MPKITYCFKCEMELETNPAFKEHNSNYHPPSRLELSKKATAMLLKSGFYKDKKYFSKSTITAKNNKSKKLNKYKKRKRA